MRFHANTSLLPSLMLSLLVVWIYDSFRYKALGGFWFQRIIAVATLSLLLFVCDHFLTYWEIDAAGLRWRRLWKVAYIHWNEVTQIGRLGFSDKYVKITYGVSIETRDYILADPTDVNGFINAMRKYIPNVEWDALPNAKPACDPWIRRK